MCLLSVFEIKSLSKGYFAVDAASSFVLLLLYKQVFVLIGSCCFQYLYQHLREAE